MDDLLNINQEAFIKFIVKNWNRGNMLHMLLLMSRRSKLVKISSTNGKESKVFQLNS